MSCFGCDYPGHYHTCVQFPRAGIILVDLTTSHHIDTRLPVQSNVSVPVQQSERISGSALTQQLPFSPVRTLQDDYTTIEVSDRTTDTHYEAHFKGYTKIPLDKIAKTGQQKALPSRSTVKRSSRLTGAKQRSLPAATSSRRSRIVELTDSEEEGSELDDSEDSEDDDEEDDDVEEECDNDDDEEEELAPAPTTRRSKSSGQRSKARSARGRAATGNTSSRQLAIREKQADSVSKTSKALSRLGLGRRS